MFFGMSNSPASFQRFMNGILEELYEHFEKKGVLEIQCILQNYMDDCGIGTVTDCLLTSFCLLLFSFLFGLLTPPLSVTPGRLAHAYVFTYGLLLRFLETSIQFPMLPSLLLDSFLSSSLGFW